MLIHLKSGKVIGVNKTITKEEAAPYIEQGAIWKDTAPAAIQEFLSGAKDVKYNGVSFTAVDKVAEVKEMTNEEKMLDLLLRIAAKIGA